MTKRIFILGLWLVHSLCFVYTKLCSNATFYWMISNNHVNSSHLEIVTFVLVCDTWGSARVTESKPAEKMGHFRVISQCRINQYVDHLQNLKHLWVEYSKKEHVQGVKMNELPHSAKISILPRLTPTTVFKLNLGTAWRDLTIISWEQVTFVIWPTLMKILHTVTVTVTEIQVCLIKM